jgi:hypothetical protein
MKMPSRNLMLFLRVRGSETNATTNFILPTDPAVKKIASTLA